MLVFQITPGAELGGPAPDWVRRYYTAPRAAGAAAGYEPAAAAGGLRQRGAGPPRPRRGKCLGGGGCLVSTGRHARRGDAAALLLNRRPAPPMKSKRGGTGRAAAWARRGHPAARGGVNACTQAMGGRRRKEWPKETGRPMSQGPVLQGGPRKRAMVRSGSSALHGRCGGRKQLRCA